MKRQRLNPTCRLVVSLLLLPVASALSESNTSTVISGVYSNAPSGVSVGYSGTNNTLMINGGGVLNTTNWSVIGFLEDAYFNVATVTDAGSRWVTKSTFFAGCFGSFNRLTISAGGTVINSNMTYIGFDAISSNNTAVVTGSGSTWTNNRTLNVGEGGPNNSVTVSNQGRVCADYINVGDLATAWSNRLLVTGTGSVVSVVNNVTCGMDGSSNRMDVVNGARIEDYSGNIGWYTDACHNAVTISGSGSTWSNRGRFYVGRWGSFNSLLITNGGFVYSGDESHIGEQSNGIGNIAIVTGTGSIWSVSNMFYVGSQGASNRLEIRNGGLVSNNWCAYIGDTGLGNSNSHGNTVLVTGTNSRWVVHDTWYMGRLAGWNRMELRDGALLSDSNAYLGWGQSIFPSNTVDVSGPGTIWTNSGELYVSGLGNAVIVSNGATVYARDFRAGGGSDTMPASIVINGSNVQLIAAGRAIAGLSTSYGTILVTNGARLFSDDGMIGQESFDQSNCITVAGSGSTWSNNGTVTVGYYGTRNSLVVNRAGRLHSANGRVGANSGGDYNLARVSDTGSVWICTNSFAMGFGHQNTLLVESGAVATCSSASIGYAPNATSNRIFVTGNGTVWSNSGDLTIGIATRANWNGLIVSNGAFAVTRSFTLGQTGYLNRLLVENGSRFVSQTSTLGVATASVGNVATVMGAESSWSNAGPLVVGLAGASKSLVIGGGASVYADSVIVGISNTARNCSIELQTGTLVSAAGLILNTNACLTGVGTVTVSSATFDNYGTVSPGMSPGRLRVNGNFVQRTGSTLNLDIAGTNTGSDYDQLSASGSFTYGGTFTVVRARGYIPKVGDAFVLVTYASQIGSSFDTYNLPPWFGWQISSESTRIVLTVNSLHLATNDIPKAWLADYGWTNDFDAAATNDADGDHVATWEEYYAGTDPTNGSSFFQCLEISKTNLPTLGQIIRWNAVTGRVYAIDASTNLASGWQELTNNLVAPINSWTDTVGSASRHYRLRAGP